jgi:formylglycine-generating enzyme required for sulfatase activity
MIHRFLFPFAAAAALAAPALAADAVKPPPATIKDPSSGMELVFVKGGCYQMGNLFNDNDNDRNDTNNLPVHEVCVGDFYLGKYEATQAEWEAVMGENPVVRAGFPDNCKGARCAVSEVTHADVEKFIARLNEKITGARYRLPTEAEWEYAARSGGKAERFSGGNDVESVSWNWNTTGYQEDKEAPWFQPVGLRMPNGLGIYDMSGNVYEMVSDYYDQTYYARSPRDNPTGPATGDEWVERGGCGNGMPGNGRTWRRTAGNLAGSHLGFRLLRTP